MKRILKKLKEKIQNIFYPRPLEMDLETFRRLESKKYLKPRRYHDHTTF